MTVSEYIHFDPTYWEGLCRLRSMRCAKRSLSPMHFVMILGQEIDALLSNLDPAQQAQAIEIAREVGYETPQERTALEDWLCANADRAQLPLKEL